MNTDTEAPKQIIGKEDKKGVAIGRMISDIKGFQGGQTEVPGALLPDNGGIVNITVVFE